MRVTRFNPLWVSVSESIYFSLVFYDLRFLFQCQVSFELRKLADKKGADEEKFNQLATTVEAFINSLLDPLRSDKKLCEEFGEQVLDHIIDDAIDLDQMKVFLNCRNF